MYKENNNKKLRNTNSKLSTYISDRAYIYAMQSLDDVEIIFYESKIYVPQSLRKHVIDWYHLYLNHSGGSTLAKRIRGLCYWKGVVAQADLYAKTCKICEQFKNINNIYGHMPPKNIAELKPWDLVHVDLIGPYRKSIRKHHPGGAIIRKNVSLTCMTIIETATGWLEIIEIPTFDLDEVTSGNGE